MVLLNENIEIINNEFIDIDTILYKTINFIKFVNAFNFYSVAVISIPSICQNYDWKSRKSKR